MLVLLTLAVIILLGLLVLEKLNTVKISDTLPDNPTPKNCWMKFQNEGAKYIKIKDGKIYLKIKE